MRLTRHDHMGGILFYFNTSDDSLFHGYYTSSSNRRYYVMDLRIGYSSTVLYLNEKQIEYYI